MKELRPWAISELPMRFHPFYQLSKFEYRDNKLPYFLEKFALLCFCRSAWTRAWACSRRFNLGIVFS